MSNAPARELCRYCPATFPRSLSHSNRSRLTRLPLLPSRRGRADRLPANAPLPDNAARGPQAAVAGWPGTVRMTEGLPTPPPFVWPAPRTGLSAAARARAGWAASAAIHAAVAAGLTWGPRPAADVPVVEGRRDAVALVASFAVPVPPPRVELPPLLDLPVVIEPAEAWIAERRFVDEPTTVPPDPAPRRAARPAPPLDSAPPAPVTPPLVARREVALLPPPDSVPPPEPPLARTPPPAVAPQLASVANEPENIGSRRTEPPRLAYHPPPIYPAVAVARGWSGRVLLRLTVGADGRVERVELAESSGHEVLDASALAAVERWRFEPARQAGRAVALTVLLPVVFEVPRR